MRLALGMSIAGSSAATLSTGDVTAPVLSGNSLNDTDDEFTFSTTEGGTLVWGISSTATPLTPDGAGGWTEATVDEGTDTVATSGQSTLSITTTASGAVYLNYYVRDAAGNDSNVITESFTVNAASFIDNFDRANQALESSADWTEWYKVANGSGDILSNQLRLKSISNNWEVIYECEDIRSSANQFIEVTVASFNAPTWTNLTLVLRSTLGTAPTYSGYRVSFEFHLDSVTMAEVTNGTSTGLGSASSLGLTSGTVIRFEANGSTIRLLIDGVEKITNTNSTHTGIGQALIRATGSSNAHIITLDDFNYGEL